MSGSSVIEAWGSSVDERRSSYPCDGIVVHPNGTLFRAVDVIAPAPLVFRWLCQLRVAPYSYDWIDNFGRSSPRRLVAGLEQLEVGQRFMTIFRLASFEEGSSVTVVSKTPAFGHVACTYRVVETGRSRSRLVAKLTFATPGGPFGFFMRHLLPAGDLVMMRRQLLNLKALAEGDAKVPGPA